MRKPALLLSCLLALVLGGLAAPPAAAAYGSISGRATAGDYVTLIPLFDANEQQTLPAEDGSYAFEGVQPGSYLVCSSEFYSLGVNSGISGTTEPRDCWQGRHYAGSATPVVVGNGQHVTGIDLERSPFGIVWGSVVDSEGVDVEYATVTALVWGERTQRWEEAGRFGPMGGFYNSYQLAVVKGVPFRLCVHVITNLRAPGCYGGVDVWDAESLTVAEGEQRELTITLPDSAEISGVITDAGGAPVPGIYARGYRLDGDGRWRMLPGASDDSQYSRSDGSYRLAGLAAGTYRVCFFDTNSVEWSSRCHGGETYPPGDEPPLEEADDIVLAEGQVVEGLDIALDPYVFIANISPPQVTGALRVGSTLTASDGTWVPDNVTVSHMWRLDGTVVGTGAQLTLLPGNQGKELVLRAIGTAPGGTPTTRTVNLGYVQQGQFSITTKPVVTGQAKVGRTLRLTKGSWSPTPATLKASFCVGSVCQPGTSIRLQRAWKGKKVYGKVEASAPGYTTRKWTSPKVTVR